MQEAQEKVEEYFSLKGFILSNREQDDYIYCCDDDDDDVVHFDNDDLLPGDWRTYVLSEKDMEDMSELKWAREIDIIKKDFSYYVRFGYTSFSDFKMPEISEYGYLYFTVEENENPRGILSDAFVQALKRDKAFKSYNIYYSAAGTLCVSMEYKITPQTTLARIASFFDSTLKIIDQLNKEILLSELYCPTLF